MGLTVLALLTFVPGGKIIQDTLVTTHALELLAAIAGCSEEFLPDRGGLRRRSSSSKHFCTVNKHFQNSRTKQTKILRSEAPRKDTIDFQP